MTPRAAKTLNQVDARPPGLYGGGPGRTPATIRRRIRSLPPRFPGYDPCRLSPGRRCALIPSNSISGTSNSAGP